MMTVKQNPVVKCHLKPPKHKFMYFHSERGYLGLDSEKTEIISGWLNDNRPTSPKTCHKVGCSNILHYDSVLCDYHLYTELNLSVAPSKTLLKKGIYTLALYCGRHLDETRRGTKVQSAVVFKPPTDKDKNNHHKKPHYICDYTGEYLDGYQFNNRYDYYTAFGNPSIPVERRTTTIDPSGPYVVQLGSTENIATSVIDSCVRRSIGSYANDVSKAPSGTLPNAKFERSITNRTVYLRAIKPIKQGEEIWIEYKMDRPKKQKQAKKGNNIYQSRDHDINYWSGVDASLIRFATVEVENENEIDSRVSEQIRAYDFHIAGKAKTRKGRPRKCNT